MIFLFDWVIFRFHVGFQGCNISNLHFPMFEKKSALVEHLACASRLPSTQHLQMWVKRVVVASLHFLMSWKYQQTPEASKKTTNGKNQTGRVSAEKGADFYTLYVAPVESRVSNNWKAGLLNSFDVSTPSLH